jgi:hypothetical protein
MADFDAPRLTIVGFAKFELPGHTIRLCDGGFVYHDGEKYTSADPTFGAIEQIAEVDENTGDEAPGLQLTFLPASSAAAATLSNPAYQGARVRFWMGRVDEQTGQLAGEPELLRDLRLDTTTLRPGKSVRRLDMELIGDAERLFLINDGNVLSPRFHKSVWPGESGLDNATGVALSVAWGTSAPPRGSVAGGGSAGGGGAVGGGGGGGAREGAQVALV